MIELPFPPTLNRYYRTYRGRILISEAGRAYRKTVGKLLMLTRFPKFGDSRLKVIMNVYPPDRRKRDLDNILKGSIDALESAGLFDDDSQIDDMRIIRNAPEKPGRITIHIEALT